MTRHAGLPSTSASRPALRRPRAARPRVRSSVPRARGMQLRRGRTTLRRVRIALEAAFAITVALALFMAINWAYQAYRKPSELLFPVSGRLYKSPTETWRQYGTLFEKNATAVITADFLAALAQVEAAGNPLARTYWRWSWSLHPFQMYRPASSAVGMFQLTDGTFAEARRYCIREHQVVDETSGGQACWFNGLYTRVLPSHAIELTAAYLDRNVAVILSRRHVTRATLARKQELAAMIHLCGAGAADAYARRGFRVGAGEHCGDHAAGGYLARVRAMQTVFRPLAVRDAA